MTPQIPHMAYLELLSRTSPALTSWSRKRTRTMPSFRKQYQLKNKRTARAKHSKRIEIVNMAKDSRSSNRVQLIDSSQEGHIKLKNPRRYFPPTRIPPRQTS